MSRLLAFGAVVAVALLWAGTASARPLVEAERTGGFAGVHDHLVIRASGAGTYTDRDGHRHRLRRATTRDARRVLRRSDFSSLRRSYRPRGVVSDAFEYRVRYRGHTVVYVDGAEGVPERLRTILSELSALMAGR
jgi:hypothetical protein